MTRRGLLLLSTMTSLAAVALPSRARAAQPFFSAATLEIITDDPTQIAAVYTNERGRFLATLGEGFNAEPEDLIKFGFCSILAYELKPYGPVTLAITLTGLLALPTLECSYYAQLAWRLFQVLCPTSGIKITAVGWDGGAVVNHAQLIAVGSPGHNWLVDPTIGLLVREVDFNWLAMGRPVDPIYLRDLYWRPGLEWFHNTVVSAVREGQYRPSDLLYYISDVERFCHTPDRARWMTPAADRVRMMALAPGNPDVAD